MVCGCTTCGNTNPNCSCNCTTAVAEAVNCATVCTAIQIANAWNIPACDSEAVLSVPGLTTVLIGSYIFNPTYGWFKITAFDSVNFELTVLNECLDANAVPGTVVPALTVFIFGVPPGTTNVTYASYSSGTYTLTGVTAPLAFSGNQASIVITIPGTYIIFPTLTFGGNGATTAAITTFVAKLRRQNNTPADIIADSSLAGTQLPLTTFTGTFSTASIAPAIYTTLNSTDLININANRSGSVPSVGSFEVINASIVAVKLA